MYCSKCGKQIDDQAVACIHCGVRIGSAQLPESLRRADEQQISEQRQEGLRQPGEEQYAPREARNQDYRYEQEPPQRNQQNYQPINVIVNTTASAPTTNTNINTSTATANANANAGVSTAVADDRSYFDGGLLQLIGWSLLGAFITFITFGICLPWALCMFYRWKIDHTVIGGRRLLFVGRATSLFGHWIKWLLLSIITFGIYLLWVGIALEKWRVKNTVFAS